jgi:predicted ATPase
MIMRLEAFRVQNYKKVRDTGWVTCRGLTVFVGKNEAGKSAIFRGLSKLNPSDGERYDGLKEFPRRRYTDEFFSQDWPVASGRFVLDDAERQALAELCPVLKGVKRVEVTRHYSGTLSCEFEPKPKEIPVSRAELRDAIDEAITQLRDLTAPEGKGEALTPVKQGSLAALEAAKNAAAGDSDAPKSVIEQAVNAIATHSNEDWQKKLLDPVVLPFKELDKRAAIVEKLAYARTWVQTHLPKFIYFDRFDVLDSSIHIPTFVQQINGGGPRVRTTHCLFRHVGLDVQKLVGLGRHQPGQGEDTNIRRQVDERAILTSSASNAITQKFEDWWEQRQHKFRYQVDGDYFRIWVSDDLDPSEIELDQRSVGMQYFFSFYVVFLVESEGEHANSILLLDEPGLHLHGTAQAKVVKFLEKLSKDNQTLYSTHSPFMVDADHLERARAVYEDDDGSTRISEDIWPRDKDCLFPLQAALGYQLAQGLFLSKRQLLVEGLTDYWLIKALNEAFALRKLTTLRSGIAVVPSAGISKLLPLASMLTGHDVEVTALLDGDEPARREGKKLADNLLGGKGHKCLFIGDFVTMRQAELEDIFPEDEYLSAVRQAYSDVDLKFNTAEKAIPEIVNRVQMFFERKNLGRFEKWRPAAILRDRILAEPEDVSKTVCDTMVRIFGAINSLFSDSAE